MLGTRKWYYYAYVQDDFKVHSESDPEPRPALRVLRRQPGSERPLQGLRHVRMQRLLPARHAVVFPGPQQLRSAHRPCLVDSGKTVIRTGAGIYHGPGQIDDQNAALDNMADNYSLTTLEAPGLSYPVAPFLRLAQDVGITPRSLQRDRRDLYSAQWGFSIQQELPAGFITQIGYVGSSGSKCRPRKYINNLDPVTKVRPLPTFGRMDEKRKDGKSNFNALQVSLHRRVARGLNWGTEYMWSHSINDNSIGGGEGTQPQMHLCRACDRGNSAQDIRHTITSNWMYELPFGPGQRYLNCRAGFEDLRRLGDRAASGRRAPAAC